MKSTENQFYFLRWKEMMNRFYGGKEEGGKDSRRMV
jgi:hypothetical protein